MEKMPSNNPVQSEENPWENTEKITQEALAKRPEFKAALDSATTFAEVRAAVEAFAVEDTESGDKQIVNFMEGAIADENEMDGVESYSEVMQGIDELEKNGASTYEEISNKVFNYAIAGKVAELLDIKS